MADDGDAVAMPSAAEQLAALNEPILRERDAAMETVSQMQQQVDKSNELVAATRKDLKERVYKESMAEAKIGLLKRRSTLLEDELKASQNLVSYEEQRNAILERHINRLRNELAAYADGDDDQRVKEMQGRIQAMKDELQLKDDQLGSLRTLATDERQAGNLKGEEASKALEELEAVQKNMKVKDDQIVNLQEQVSLFKSQITAKDEQIAAITDRANMLLDQLKETTQALVDAEEGLANQSAGEADLRKQIQDLTTTVAEREADIEAEKTNTSSVQALLDSASDRETSLNEEIDRLNNKIEELIATGKKQSSDIGQRDGQIESRDDEIKSLKDKIRAQGDEMDKLNAEIVRLSVTTKDADGNDVRSAADIEYAALLKSKDELLAANRAEFNRLEDVITEKDKQVRDLITTINNDEEKNKKRMQDNINIIAENKGLTEENSRLARSEEIARTALERLQNDIVEKDAGLTEAQSELNNLKVEFAQLEDSQRIADEKIEQMESAMEEVREQLQAAQDTAAALTEESAEKDTEIEKLAEELDAIKEGELPGAKERLADLQTQKDNLQTNIKGRDDRIARLQKSCETFRAAVASLTKDKATVTEELETLKETTLPQLERERDDAKQRNEILEAHKAETNKQVQAAQAKLREAQEDVRQRVDQIRGLFTKLSAKEEELNIMTNQSKYYETHYNSEKAMAGGAQDRVSAAHEGWTKARKDVDELWSRINDLQTKLINSEEMLKVKSDESEMSKQEADNERFLAVSKSERMKILSDRMAAVRDDMRSKDERLVLLKEVRKRMQDEEFKLRKQVAEGEDEIADLKDQVHKQKLILDDKDIEIEKLTIRVKHKDEEIHVLSKRVDLARSEVSMQLELLESKMQQSREDFDAKTVSAEAQIKQIVEQTADEDKQMSSKYRKMEQSFKKTQQALKAKDSLVHMMTQKLTKVNDALVKKEGELTTIEVELSKRIKDLENELLEHRNELAEAQEDAELARKELDAQKDVTSEYRRQLVAAETGAEAKEEQLTGLSNLLTEMKDDIQAQKESMSAVEMAENPAAKGAEEHEAGVNEQYFKSITLLIKSQLFESGHMQNVLVDDLWEEVKNSGKPVEEYASFVFQKAFDYEL